MTLKEFAGVDSYLVDEEAGVMLADEEFYDRCIERLGGLGAVKPFVPFGVEQIREAIQHDKHLNSLPLHEWDRAAGFTCAERGNASKTGDGLAALCSKHGVTVLSCAEGVCLLKEAARQLAEMEEVE